MKKSITKNEYWQLVGLQTLANNYMAKVDDLEKVVDTFPNHKPLSELDEKEFVIENADMSLGIVEGQLVSMGIDPQKLIKEVIHNFKLEPEDIFCSIEIEDKNEEIDY
jgi:hypothetical protein